jgi:hypothetical protein
VNVYTSHLGDSGMKNRPGINTVQGKAPTSMASHISIRHYMKPKASIKDVCLVMLSLLFFLASLSEFC